jgi:hypothetical protein
MVVRQEVRMSSHCFWRKPGESESTGAEAKSVSAFYFEGAHWTSIVSPNNITCRETAHHAKQQIEKVILDSEESEDDS